MTDERGQAPQPRRRRRVAGASRLPGMNLRLRGDVAEALERDADSSRRSKTAIVEETLATKYGLPA